MLRNLRDWLSGRKALGNRIAELEQALRMREQEMAALRRMLGAAHDTIDRHAWQQRALGAEAKVVAESMRGA